MAVIKWKSLESKAIAEHTGVNCLHDVVQSFQGL